jgi:magnesium transporter
MQETLTTSLHLDHRAPPGTHPGALRAPADAETTAIELLAYSETEVVERKGIKAEDVKPFLGKYPVIWVNVTGLADVSVFEKLRDDFKLHWLAVEDAFNIGQRPKVDEYDDHLFVVARALDTHVTQMETEQLAIFLGQGFVITVQEHAGDSFDPVRDRIRRGKGRLRRSGPDYLCYALIDSVVDSYFPVLESYGESLEKLEGEVVQVADRRLINRIHRMKRELLTIRRAIWPHREMVSTLAREDCEYVTPTTRIYLRDCYDHTIQAMDVVETYREIASSLIDVYMSSVSAKLNEIMKVLTIISTIFIPLGFIASVYGMNFRTENSPFNMPELNWYYGYPFALGLMTLVAFSLVFYFWRSGWIGSKWRRRRKLGL